MLLFFPPLYILLLLCAPSHGDKIKTKCWSSQHAPHFLPANLSCRRFKAANVERSEKPRISESCFSVFTTRATLELIEAQKFTYSIMKLNTNTLWVEMFSWSVYFYSSNKRQIGLKECFIFKQQGVNEIGSPAVTAAEFRKTRLGLHWATLRVSNTTKFIRILEEMLLGLKPIRPSLTPRFRTQRAVTFVSIWNVKLIHFAKCESSRIVPTRTGHDATLSAPIFSVVSLGHVCQFVFLCWKTTSITARLTGRN